MIPTLESLFLCKPHSQTCLCDQRLTLHYWLAASFRANHTSEQSFKTVFTLFTVQAWQYCRNSSEFYRNGHSLYYYCSVKKEERKETVLKLDFWAVCWIVFVIANDSTRFQWLKPFSRLPNESNTFTPNIESRLTQCFQWPYGMPLESFKKNHWNIVETS